MLNVEPAMQTDLFLDAAEDKSSNVVNMESVFWSTCERKKAKCIQMHQRSMRAGTIPQKPGDLLSVASCTGLGWDSSKSFGQGSSSQEVQGWGASLLAHLIPSLVVAAAQVPGTAIAVHEGMFVDILATTGFSISPDMVLEEKIFPRGPANRIAITSLFMTFWPWARRPHLLVHWPLLWTVATLGSCFSQTCSKPDTLATRTRRWAAEFDDQFVNVFLAPWDIQRGDCARRLLHRLAFCGKNLGGYRNKYVSKTLPPRTSLGMVLPNGVEEVSQSHAEGNTKDEDMVSTSVLVLSACPFIDDLVLWGPLLLALARPLYRHHLLGKNKSDEIMPTRWLHC